ncbi:Crp/Fnr family transcriptional regulator [Rhodospirillum sp. A1_3_36]|uniref:Crp/Fnr family transcriptional regulator n=1 Tax=Rhodospirillum sp. A1_3_36 TaxID=3391666 RepID=UPI0039A5A97B
MRYFVANPAGFERKTFADGAVLFREGDSPDCVYMVESGLVDIIIRRPDGGRTVIGTIGKGEMFGEMALIDNEPRMATAEVSMEATLVCIPAEAFRAQMKTVNPVMSKVMLQMVKRMRAVARELAFTKVD